VSIFGPLVVETDLTNAVIAKLKLWLPTYVAEVERQQNLDPRSLPLPRSYSIRTTPTKWREDQTPAVIAVSPGLFGDPERDGEGQWRAPWGVSVITVTAAVDQENTDYASKMYAAAIRGALLQNQPVDDAGSTVRWLDEEYTDIPTDRDRSLAGARVDFELLVPCAVDEQAGPWPGSDPPEDPYAVPPGWSTVTDPDLTVSPLED
jgi:hypothetical protein